MAYETSAKQSNAIPVNSLLSDTESLVERLRGVYNHLIDLGNTLHGSQPRDASDGAKIEPEPTVRRNLDKALSSIAEIESELQRIAARV